MHRLLPPGHRKALHWEGTAGASSWRASTSLGRKAGEVCWSVVARTYRNTYLQHCVFFFVAHLAICTACFGRNIFVVLMCAPCFNYDSRLSCFAASSGILARLSADKVFLHDPRFALRAYPAHHSPDRYTSHVWPTHCMRVFIRRRSARLMGFSLARPNEALGKQEHASSLVLWRSLSAATVRSQLHLTRYETPAGSSDSV